MCTEGQCEKPSTGGKGGGYSSSDDDEDDDDEDEPDCYSDDDCRGKEECSKDGVCEKAERGGGGGKGGGGGGGDDSEEYADGECVGQEDQYSNMCSKKSSETKCLQGANKDKCEWVEGGQSGSATSSLSLSASMDALRVNGPTLHVLLGVSLVISVGFFLQQLYRCWLRAKGSNMSMDKEVTPLLMGDSV